MIITSIMIAKKCGLNRVFVLVAKEMTLKSENFFDRPLEGEWNAPISNLTLPVITINPVNNPRSDKNLLTYRRAFNEYSSIA